MKGISSQAAGKLENKYKYNGKEQQHQEFSDGSGLEWYDSHFRMYDLQLGIFHLLDKLADISEDISPYAFASDNPILRNDPLGIKDSTTLPDVTVVAHSPSLSIKSTDISAHIVTTNTWRMLADNTLLKIPIVSLQLNQTLVNRLTSIERAKDNSKDAQSLAEKAKVVTYILKQLMLKGSVDVKYLGLLKEYAGKGGNIALAAEAVLNIWQATNGEITPDECYASLAKLGFVAGIGAFGEILGGPIGGYVLSTGAEKLIGAANNIPNIPYIPGSENIEINLNAAFHP